mgnify:CR=1 FL=1
MGRCFGLVYLGIKGANANLFCAARGSSASLGMTGRGLFCCWELFLANKRFRAASGFLFFIAPFQGLFVFFGVFSPGRCPGLLYFAPLGLLGRYILTAERWGAFNLPFFCNIWLLCASGRYSVLELALVLVNL